MNDWISPEDTNYPKNDQDESKDEEVRATSGQIWFSDTYIKYIIHEKIVNPITITAVIPVAVKTIYGLVAEQIIPISKPNTIVNTINIGKPNLRTKSVQQAITIDIAINKTDRAMMAGVLTNAVLKI